MDGDDDEKVEHTVRKKERREMGGVGPWMSENVYITDLKTRERYQPRVLCKQQESQTRVLDAPLEQEPIFS